MTDSELPDAELDVMGCLWQDGSLTAREIRESLEDTRPMAHASVCTLLKRLEAKELIKREKAKTGKAFVYSALVRPGKTRRKMVGDLLDRVFGGSGVDLVASLLESRPPTADEVAQLQELLDDLRQRQNKKRKRGSK